MTTGEMKGPFALELNKAHEERVIKEEEAAKAKEKEMKIEEDAKRCDLIKEEIIKQLDERYHLNNINELIIKLDVFLESLEKHLQNPSDESKEAVHKTIFPLRELTTFFKNFREG